MPHDHNFHEQSSQSANPKILDTKHDHSTPILEKNEARTRWVVWLTLLTMVVELLVGWWTNSMALTADGWHMASHAGALGLTLFGYGFARKYDKDPRFSFGTGKVFALTGFASAIALFVAGVLVAGESIHHMVEPKPIEFGIAMWVAIVGLIVNLLSAWLLSHDESAGHNHGHNHSHNHSQRDPQKDGHDHSHDHGHDATSTPHQQESVQGHDHNLRGAYLHVIADALTSVLAIVALFLGQQFDWWILDPLMGVVGGVIIIRWAIQLTKETGWVLLSALPNREIEHQILQYFSDVEGVEVLDLHLWDLGLSRHCCILSVVSDTLVSPNVYKQGLCDAVALHHCTIEVHLRSNLEDRELKKTEHDHNIHDHTHDDIDDHDHRPQHE
jgi:cation diffusion facilitator family transporter